MKIKKSELYFYEMLRDFLNKYLVIQRSFSPATVGNYTASVNQYREYLRKQKDIPFDKAGFHCFTKEMIYDFCIWLRDDQSRAINTVNFIDLKAKPTRNLNTRTRSSWKLYLPLQILQPGTEGATSIS